MKDNQHILKYNIEFTRLATQTGWDDTVLRHCYYSGLADRIKDIMGQQGKPDTLDKMRILAHSIDARHWERVCSGPALVLTDPTITIPTNPTNPTKSLNSIIPTNPATTRISPKVPPAAATITRTTSPKPSQTRLPTSWEKMAN